MIAMDLLQRRVRPLVAGITTACLLLAALLPAAVSAAPRPITLFVPILDSNRCLEGRVTDNGKVNVTLRSSTGNIDGVGRNLQADADGFWFFCAYRGPVIHSGDSITVKVVGTGQKRMVTVPQLSARVNRNSDTVKGYGPAGQTLSVSVFDDQQIVPDYDITENVTTNGSGRYSIDFSSQADLVGEAGVVVAWESAQHDVFEISAAAPSITLSYHGHNFEGETNRGDRVRVTLKDSGGDVLARGNDVGFECCNGFYFGTFYRDANHEYIVEGGEQVWAPAIGSDTGWVVPSVNGTVDVGTDVVAGTCFPNMPVWVDAFSLEAPVGGFMAGTADGAGNFSLDLSSEVNIKARFVVIIGCPSASGDRVTHEFIARRTP